MVYLEYTASGNLHSLTSGVNTSEVDPGKWYSYIYTVVNKQN